LGQVNKAIESLTEEQKDIEFKLDLARLAADSTAVLQYVNACHDSGKAQHLLKISHLREQNTLGVNQIERFMDGHCKFALADKAVAINTLYDTWRQRVADHNDNLAEIVWFDCTKFGRMESKDLDHGIERMKHVLTRNPLHSVGLIIAPILSSNRPRAEVGDRRRIEDKLGMKGLVPVSCALAMDGATLHGHNRTRTMFDLYLVFVDSTLPDEEDGTQAVSENVFARCSLKVRRTTAPAAFLEPRDYIVPRGAGHATTGGRDLSERQRAAQLLGGPNVPLRILEALFAEVRWPEDQTMLVVDLSPYDAALELVALEMHSRHHPRCRTIALSTDPDGLLFAQKRALKELLDDWKNARATRPPPAVGNGKRQG
jgi:hypothetical protein